MFDVLLAEGNQRLQAWILHLVCNVKYEVTESLAEYFFNTGACKTNQPDQDKQCPIRCKQPSVQLLPLASPSGVIIALLCNGVAGLYIVGPLYRVITEAPATHNIVPITFAVPSFLFIFTCSILY